MEICLVFIAAEWEGLNSIGVQKVQQPRVPPLQTGDNRGGSSASAAVLGRRKNLLS